MNKQALKRVKDLVQRELQFFINELKKVIGNSTIKLLQMNNGKRRRPFSYSKTEVVNASAFRFLMKQRLRQTTVLIKKSSWEVWFLLPIMPDNGFSGNKVSNNRKKTEGRSKTRKNFSISYWGSSTRQKAVIEQFSIKTKRLKGEMHFLSTDEI